MSNFQQHISQEIKELLESTSGHENSDNLLHHDIQQIKSNIIATFGNHINGLQLKEQWLLQQVDSVHACCLQTLQTNAEQLTEIEDQLGYLLDLVQPKQATESKSFNVYIESIFKALHSLMEDEDQYNIPSSIEIDQRGTSVANGSELGSDHSWCFADSIGSASPAEPVDCESCVGIPLDVEDLSKNLCLIEKFMQKSVMSLNDVCMADEMCGNISECVNCQPCNGDHEAEREENPYVTAIDHALKSIILQQSTVTEEKQPITKLQEGNDLTSCQPIQLVRSLQEEIDRIVAGESKSQSRMESPRIPSIAPWSANLLAAQIADIVQSSLPTVQLEAPNIQVLDLVSQVDAIVSGESFLRDESSLTVTKGTEAFMSDDFFLETNYQGKVSDPTMRATLALSKILADCSITSTSPLRPSDQTKTYEEGQNDNCVAKGDGWSVVEQVHGLVTEILNS